MQWRGGDAHRDIVPRLKDGKSSEKSQAETKKMLTRKRQKRGKLTGLQLLKD